MVGLMSIAASAVLSSPYISSPYNWTNEAGGPIVEDRLQALLPPRMPAHSPPAAPALALRGSNVAHFNYTLAAGYLAAGHDIGTLVVSSVQEALDACSTRVQCRGVTYKGGTNGSISSPTKVYLKKAGGRTAGASPWASWSKIAPVLPPAATLSFDGIELALRAESGTVQWLNCSGANYSIVPPLTSGSALPLMHHLGDVTL